MFVRSEIIRIMNTQSVHNRQRSQSPRPAVSGAASVANYQQPPNIGVRWLLTRVPILQRN